MEDGTQLSQRRFTTFWEEKRVILICFLIALAQFQYGYDSAAVSGFQAMPGFLIVFGYKDPASPIGYNISSKVQRLIQSLMNLGGLVGAIMIYALGPRFSRRVGLWTASAIGVVAISIQIGSKDTGALYAGRLLLGISNGWYLPFSVTYMSEITPAHLRGPIVGLVTMQTTVGALFGILVDNYTTSSLGRRSYQIPLAVMYIIPLFLSILLIFLPDTPRYYVSRGEEAKAIASIRKARGITDVDRIKEVVEDIQTTWAAEQELHQGVHVRDMFRGTDLRRTLITFGAAIGQTGSGIIFISGYSVYFYVQAHIGAPFTWVMVGLAIGLTGSIASFIAMRYIGRRPLLIVSCILSAAMMFGMAIVYTKSTVGSSAAGKALVGLSIVYTWLYAFGQGPVLWAISSEVPSQRLRSQTIALANGINFVFAWLCSFCTPYFINPDQLNWGPKYGYIWGPSNLILALWVLWFVPETQGRSLEQLDELFEKRVSALKFAKYKTDHQLIDAKKGPEYSEKEALAHSIHVEDKRATET